jgi:hypothetical protein
MILSEEPLPHEVFGLQVLIGAIGTQVAGFVGCLMGTFQIAPCISWMPGRVGDGVRAVGWQTFAVLRSWAHATSTTWRVSGAATAGKGLVAACKRFDRDTRATALASAACLAVLRFIWRGFEGLASTVATAGAAAARGVPGRGDDAARQAAPPAEPRADE